jgi:hypothetical protein
MRRRKLILRASTVRQLAGQDLERAVAGEPHVPWSERCPSVSCAGNYTCECPY